jgi:hypothetical protein
MATEPTEQIVPKYILRAPHAKSMRSVDGRIQCERGVIKHPTPPTTNPLHPAEVPFLNPALWTWRKERQTGDAWFGRPRLAKRVLRFMEIQISMDFLVLCMFDFIWTVCNDDKSSFSSSAALCHAKWRMCTSSLCTLLTPEG